MLLDDQLQSNSMHLGASPKLFILAKELRKNMTIAERLLWKKLNQDQLADFKFRRQHPILYFIVDFYCHSHKLVIEVDGGYHNDSQQKEYDLGRSEELEKYGITVIRFKNGEIETDLEGVSAKIVTILKNK